MFHNSFHIIYFILFFFLNFSFKSHMYSKKLLFATDPIHTHAHTQFTAQHFSHYPHMLEMWVNMLERWESILAQQVNT